MLQALTIVTQRAGSLNNISTLRKIGTGQTRVQYIPYGEKRAVTDVIDVDFDQLHAAISAAANAKSRYTGHRFVELLREHDNTPYAILCKICGGVHKIYHTPCHCKLEQLAIPLSEAQRARLTKTGLTLGKQKLELYPGDARRFDLTGVTINKHRDDIRVVQVQQIHEENGFIWGYVKLAGRLHLVCAQDDDEGSQPVLSDLTRAGRQWTWALESKN